MTKYRVIITICLVSILVQLTYMYSHFHNGNLAMMLSMVTGAFVGLGVYATWTKD